MAKLEKVHLFISGKVQGVGFRYHTQQEALFLNIKGFVRNLPDGRVEIEAEGELEDMEQFMEFCHKGPLKAKIEKVVVELKQETSTYSYSNFEVR